MEEWRSCWRLEVGEVCRVEGVCRSGREGLGMSVPDRVGRSACREGWGESGEW